VGHAGERRAPKQFCLPSSLFHYYAGLLRVPAAVLFWFPRAYLSFAGRPLSLPSRVTARAGCAQQPRSCRCLLPSAPPPPWFTTRRLPLRRCLSLAAITARAEHRAVTALHCASCLPPLRHHAPSCRAGAPIHAALLLCTCMLPLHCLYYFSAIFVYQVACCCRRLAFCGGFCCKPVVGCAIVGKSGTFSAGETTGVLFMTVNVGWLPRWTLQRMHGSAYIAAAPRCHRTPLLRTPRCSFAFSCVPQRHITFNAAHCPLLLPRKVVWGGLTCGMHSHVHIRLLLLFLSRLACTFFCCRLTLFHVQRFLGINVFRAVVPLRARHGSHPILF